MIYKTIFKTAIFPASELYSRTSIQKKLNFLKKSQCWTKKQLEDYQNERLRVLIHHAYNNVPYYNALFEKLKIKPSDIKTKKDLKKLPFLTKEIIKSNPESFKAKNYLSKSFEKFTSGSTGTPTKFYQTKEDYSWQWAAHYRAWGWTGYEPGDKYVKISLNDDRYLAKKRIQDKIMRCLYLYVYKMSDKEIEKYLKRIMNFKPKVLYGYSSSIYILADYMIKKGITYKVNSVITTGSKLTNKSRKKIEKAFRSEVFDGYGCGGEGLNIAAECEQHNYHVNDELLILENDKREIVVTSLFNYAMPLIRYKPRDEVSLDGKCTCGKTLSVIKNINGRSDEVILTKKGEKLVVEFIISAFELIDGIEQYQAIQTNKEGVTLKIITNNQYNKETDEKRIIDFIRNSAGKDFKIKIEYVQKINPEKNGKTRIVVNKL